MPVVSSGADGAKNVYNAFQLGFNPKAFFGRGLQTYQDHVAGGGNKVVGAGAGALNVLTSGLHGAGRAGSGLGLSLGGIATAGGLAGIGAAAGAAIGSQMEGDMVAPMAIGGAAAGLAAIPAIGLAARAGLASMRPLGMGMEATARAIPGIAGGMANVAKGMVGGLSGMNPYIGGHAGAVGNMLASPIRRHAGAIAGFGKNLVKFNSETATLGARAGNNVIGKMTKTGGVKMTGLGHSVLWGSTVVAAGAGVFNELNKSRMGQSDGRVTRATPQMTSFQNNGGATGDLVFAMNANRRG